MLGASWTPTNNANTSILEITQTRTRSCEVVVNGTADNPALTCTSYTSETQTATNPLAADTLTLGAWSSWTPTNNANTSILEITQTRTRSCEIVVNGNIDEPALTCTGYTSETQTVINPLAADTLTLGAWSIGHQLIMLILAFLKSPKPAFAVVRLLSTALLMNQH